MQTQLTCPQCGTPYSADVHQIIDSKYTPELKQQLLNGQLNMAVCPSCGYGGQMSTMLLFHDAEHDMFIIHVPTQLGLDEAQREQMIGQMTRQVMDNLPAEERRAYMFNPQMMLNMQMFMEKVLETEGVTKEMIAQQKKQSELLATLAQADKDVQDHLIKERGSEIDETFFNMLQSYIDAAAQMNNNEQILPLINLRAKLMTATPIGKTLEERQLALHAMSKEAKQAGGMSAAILLDHLVKNVDRQDVVDAIVAVGQQGMSYEFFQMMTERIEKHAEAGEKAMVEKLTTLRDQLLAFQQQLRDQSQQMLAGAAELLHMIINAPDKKVALYENMDRVDDAFMYVLSTKMEEAGKSNNTADFQALNEVQALIVEQIEGQLPPNLQLLNQLVRTETVAEQNELLDENQPLISKDMLTLMDQVIDQAKGNEREDDLNGRLQALRLMIAERVGD